MSAKYPWNTRTEASKSLHPRDAMSANSNSPSNARSVLIIAIVKSYQFNILINIFLVPFIDLDIE